MTTVVNLKVWAALLVVATISAAIVVALFVGTRPAEAAFPGTNGKIAFTSNRDGNYEVYTMNSNGTSQRNLTSSSDSDLRGKYSANGKQMVFSSNRDGNFEIYRMSATGTLQTRLTKTPAATEDTPAYSPDGTKIAFASDRDGNLEIYAMKADGTQRRRLTINGALDAFATYSPDGTKIAFASDRAGGDFDIFVMDTDPNTDDATNLTKDSTGDDTHPDWSPNGNKIAFDSNRGDSSEDIYTMNANGTDQTPLTQSAGDDRYPAYSPDGRQIAFVSDRTTGAGVTNPTGDVEIFRMSASGASETQLTFNDGFEDSVPSWQPLP